MFLIYIFFGMILLFCLYLFRPFKLKKGMSIFLGIPRSGKTTLAAYFSKKYLKKRKKVYSNVPIVGTIKYKATDLGKFDISDGCLILDEAGLEFNNRNYKNLQRPVLEFAKLYGHYGIDPFVIFSQALDVDITFVRLADRIYLIKKFLPFIVLFVGVRRRMVVDKESEQLVDGYKLDIFDIHAIFSPPVWHMFDSWDAPELPPLPDERWGNESLFTKKVNDEVN